MRVNMRGTRWPNVGRRVFLGICVSRFSPRDLPHKRNPLRQTTGRDPRTPTDQVEIARSRLQETIAAASPPQTQRFRTESTITVTQTSLGRRIHRLYTVTATATLDRGDAELHSVGLDDLQTM